MRVYVFIYFSIYWMHNIETWWWINHKVTKLMESKKIYVTVIYYYTKYIKVINHGKITYPPNIFFNHFHCLHYNIIVSGPFFLEIQIRWSQNSYRRVVQTHDLQNVCLLNIFTKLNIIISDED